MEDNVKAKKELNELINSEAYKEGQMLDPFLFSAVYLNLGDKEKALSLLELGYDYRIIQMMHVKVNPYFDALKNDERFKDLLKRLHFN